MKPQGIGQLLLGWYDRGHRDLPWRRTADPYRVWVSEIMLQQTRAQAVIPYYERFLERFPTVQALAAAGDDEVLALWAGLGYYSRARNLLKAAQQIVAAGSFPAGYDAISALPGIGDYTAAAIASIAFGLPYAVLDGNVLRVVARIQNDAADIGAPATRERFRAVAQSWLPADRAGAFNQALMELGATVCLPRNPLCLVCPLSAQCRAREHGTESQVPVKLRKMDPVKIAGVLLLIQKDGRVLLRRRDDSETRMAGFWDLPTYEEFPAASLGQPYGEFRHSITHHRYTFQVIAATGARAKNGFRWFEPAHLGAIPLSTTARKGLKLAQVL